MLVTDGGNLRDLGSSASFRPKNAKVKGEYDNRNLSRAVGALRTTAPSGLVRFRESPRSHLTRSSRAMTAVMRRLACLFLLVFVVAPFGTAAADLDELSSAAYEYRGRLYNLPPAEGDPDEARLRLEELAAGPDQVSAETLAESMVPAGYEDHQLWATLAQIKTRLGKGLEAAYA